MSPDSGQQPSSFVLRLLCHNSEPRANEVRGKVGSADGGSGAGGGEGGGGQEETWENRPQE